MDKGDAYGRRVHAHPVLLRKEIRDCVAYKIEFAEIVNEISIRQPNQYSRILAVSVSHVIVQRQELSHCCPYLGAGLIPEGFQDCQIPSFPNFRY